MKVRRPFDIVNVIFVAYHWELRFSTIIVSLLYSQVCLQIFNGSTTIPQIQRILRREIRRPREETLNNFNRASALTRCNDRRRRRSWSVPSLGRQCRVQHFHRWGSTRRSWILFCMVDSLSLPSYLLTWRETKCWCGGEHSLGAFGRCLIVNGKLFPTIIMTSQYAF